MMEDVAAYSYLCRSVARRFTRPTVEREDLEQVAQIGLLKAMRKYRPERGVPFVNFAWRNICGELIHYVRDYEHAVRMPRAWWEMQVRERGITDTMTAENNAVPTPVDVARMMRITPTAVSVMRNGGIAAVAMPDLQSQASHAPEMRLVMREALNALPAAERLMILGVYYYGFSQTEMGAKLGYAQRRASRLHARALDHLRTSIGEL